MALAQLEGSQPGFQSLQDQEVAATLAFTGTCKTSGEDI